LQAPAVAKAGTELLQGDVASMGNPETIDTLLPGLAHDGLGNFLAEKASDEARSWTV